MHLRNLSFGSYVTQLRNLNIGSRSIQEARLEL